MTPELFECKCGCNQFLNIIPHQFEKKNITNWQTYGLQTYSGIAPVLICLSCFQIVLPPISFAGRSRLDPNVQAFGDLMKWVEEHNKRFDKHEQQHMPMISSVGSMWASGSTVEIPIESGKLVMVVEEEVAKTDKVAMPSKQETFGPSKQKNQEPKNKTKAKTTKPRKPRVQKTKSTTSKDDTNV